MVSQYETEEQELKGFENGMLRIIFGSKSDEIAGEQRQLRKDKCHNVSIY